MRFYLGRGRGQTEQRKAFELGCFHEPKRYYGIMGLATTLCISSLHSTLNLNKVTVEIIRIVVAIMDEKRLGVSH